MIVKGDGGKGNIGKTAIYGHWGVGKPLRTTFLYIFLTSLQLTTSSSQKKNVNDTTTDEMREKRNTKNLIS